MTTIYFLMKEIPEKIHQKLSALIISSSVVPDGHFFRESFAFVSSKLEFVSKLEVKFLGTQSPLVDILRLSVFLRHEDM